MTNLWLIAHKVRGEPAFDIATRIECPICHNGLGREDHYWACNECSCTGFWWIIPTSGHRAYPYAHKECEWDELSVGLPPEDLPDHYQTHAEPSRLEALKAMLPPAKPIHRRF